MFKRNRLELTALALAKIVGMAAVGCGYLGHRYLGMTLFAIAGALIIFIIARCIGKMELVSLFPKDDLLEYSANEKQESIIKTESREAIAAAMSKHIKYQITDGAEKSKRDREETIRIMDALIEELKKARKAESEEEV